MDSTTYLNECIKKHLIPFIKKNHNIDDIIFWPDMSRVHYATKVTDWLTQKKVNFISYAENAPNIPQARPIEKFWALCKAEYKKLPYPIENLE